MTLSLEEVSKIAHLARVSLTPAEEAKLLPELENIFQLVAKMDDVDTKNIEPLSHPFAEKQPLRDDQVTEADQRSIFLKMAPQTQAGLYIVPQVIETE
jgi:aspartyl-tRNA(Asn)/glutamyl-tRNA(Gln) amidotransferase subunit C